MKNVIYVIPSVQESFQLTLLLRCCPNFPIKLLVEWYTYLKKDLYTETWLQGIFWLAKTKSAR